MKTYLELSIEQRINYKANIKSKGLKFGTLPNNWCPMKMPLISQDLRCIYPSEYSSLRNY